MALSLFSGDTDVISQLDNQPNDNDGLSAAELKAKFDQFGTVLKAFLNGTLIPELETAINAAAAGIGSSGFSGAIITDGTIATEKLSSTSGIEAVSTSVIRDNAVTLSKLSTALQTLINSISSKAVATTRTVTLEAGATAWTKTVAGVTASNVVIATGGSDSTSHKLWSNCDIYCTGQSANTLTFAARTAPSSGVTANILILS